MTREFGPTKRERAAYNGADGLPTSGDFRGRRNAGPRRSVSGPLMWGMAEAIDLPADEPSVDEDGFAVFGRYPVGFIAHVVRARLLGNVDRGEILHVCSGTLGPAERWTVDLRHEARPRVVASGNALPFRDEQFKAVMLDPPYSDAYARDLYRVENPRPSWLLREAARVVRACGRIGLLHVAVPFAPPRCRFIRTYGVTPGAGYRVRAFTVFEKDQAGFLDDPADWNGTKREKGVGR